MPDDTDPEESHEEAEIADGPMTVTRAKIFIRGQVNRILWERVTWIAAGFGVINVVTLLGLYTNITSQAKTIAEEQVQKVSQKKAEELSEKFKGTLDVTTIQVAEIMKSYGDLRGKLATVGSDLTSLEQKRAQTGQELDKLAAESTDLERQFSAFKDTDTARVAQMVKAIKDLPDGNVKALIEALGENSSRYDALTDQIKSKVDSKTFETIKSERPIGSVQMFSGSLENIPKGWRLCDGSAVSSKTFPKLYAATGQLWGRGDQSLDADGNLKNFNLPDLRGQFIRGVDRGANRDPEAASRQPLGSGTVQDPGTLQNQSLIAHTHSFRLHGGASFDAPGEPHGAQGAGGSNPSARIPVDPAGGSETRPTNVSVFFIIAIE